MNMVKEGLTSHAHDTVQEQQELDEYRNGTKFICLPAVSILIKTLNRNYLKIIKQLDNVADKPRNTYLRKITVYASRMTMAHQMTMAAMRSDSKDIFYMPADHDDWKIFNQVYTG